MTRHYVEILDEDLVNTLRENGLINLLVDYESDMKSSIMANSG